jgi:hypothetical protein
MTGIATDTNGAFEPVAADEPVEIRRLQIGQQDERGNIVTNIYCLDPDYAIYSAGVSPRQGRLRLFRPHEQLGVLAELSPNPERRSQLRRYLLPLGTERAILQALLSGWPRRYSYDSSIATALQLALSSEGNPEAMQRALEILKDAKVSVLTERIIAGRAQYVRFTLISNLIGVFLLFLGQHYLLLASSNVWLGVEAGMLGALASIALDIRNRAVALDFDWTGNLADSVLRLIVGAVSGGVLILLFAAGLLPSLYTTQGVLNPGTSVSFALIAGFLGGFVERLVPSLLGEPVKRELSTSEERRSAEALKGQPNQADSFINSARPPTDTVEDRRLQAGGLYEQLERAETAAALAYGMLGSIQRLRRSSRQMVPYLALLIAAVASGSLDMVGSLLQLGRLAAEILVSTAWAAPEVKSLTGEAVIRQLVIPITFLALFVGSFAITLWDEFFAEKPRPISKDLNRAFIGFVIGQLKSIIG